MKANEFRLGSFFCYKGCIYAANVIRDNFVYGKNVNGFASGEFPINKINPIPLTEEWLLKFGFENCGYYYNKNDIRIYFVHEREFEGFVFEYGMVESFCKIRFVHELQNLYFVLNGEELILNEKL